jgi:hypothetical protein
VFAIDGYTTDDAANTVNDNYDTAAGTLLTANNVAARRASLQFLLAAVREAANTTTNATLWGGFRRNQNAPEHMWIEYNGFIYDTMPGSGLCRVPANATYRTCPGLENLDFGTGAVSIGMTLTASQIALIGGGGFIPPVH